MEWISQKANNFWVCLQGLSSFEQILLTVLSVTVLLFIFWRAKITKMIIDRRLHEWLIRYQSFRYRALWEPVAISIITIGIFIYFFGEKLLMKMDQDTLRNLILLTAGFVGWYFLYQRTKAASQNTRIAEQGLTVERLNRVTEQLASDKVSVRLGAILGLVQIFESHEEERYKITRILSTFVHDYAPSSSDTREIQYRGKGLDIEEAVKALTILTESFPANEKKILFDLNLTNLSGLSFSDANLSNFSFVGANFSNSYLHGVNFTGAILGVVNFSGVSLRDPTGLTQEQLEHAFYLKGKPPIEFPSELKLIEGEPNE